METKKSIQISFVILLIMMIIGLVYALIAFIKPDLLVARSFQLYTEQSWTDYLTASPKLADYMLILERMVGALGVVVAFGALFVLFTAFKNGLKWAWFYILVCGILSWGNNLQANVTINNPVNITVSIIGLVLMVIGLIIPAKDFWGKR